MADLTTTYLGNKLTSPIIASASPLTATVSGVQSLVDAGIGAVMIQAIFTDAYQLTPAFLAYISRLKETITIPVIVNLAGHSAAKWPLFGEQIADAGADALELSLYTITGSPAISGENVEQDYVTMVKYMKTAVSLPILVKLHPYFSALGNMAVTLEQAGADSLVFFNRFYQPDIDLDTMTIVSDLELTRADELRLRLRWAALLNQYLHKDFAITGGVYTAEDVLKCVMVGAKTAMMASALFESGAAHIATLNQRISAMLDAMGFASLADVRGIMAQEKVRDPAAYERANYMRVLKSY